MAHAFFGSSRQQHLVDEWWHRGELARSIMDRTDEGTHTLKLGHGQK